MVVAVVAVAVGGALLLLLLGTGHGGSGAAAAAVAGAAVNGGTRGAQLRGCGHAFTPLAAPSRPRRLSRRAPAAHPRCTAPTLLCSACPPQLEKEVQREKALAEAEGRTHERRQNKDIYQE